jgi:hypothetical protein
VPNINRVNGFRPVKHLTGAPYNGQANIYEVPAAEAVAIFVGDLVKVGTKPGTEGYPVAEAPGASAAGDIASGAVLGAVVGILPVGMDPVTGKMTNGRSPQLDTPQYRAASTKQFILVADSPDLIFEAQADGAVTNSNIGLNVGYNIGTHDTTNGNSAYQVDASSAAVTSTLPLTLVGFPRNGIDNEVNATYNKVLVKINAHQYANAATGATRD